MHQIHLVYSHCYRSAYLKICAIPIALISHNLDIIFSMKTLYKTRRVMEIALVLTFKSSVNECKLHVKVHCRSYTGGTDTSSAPGTDLYYLSHVFSRPRKDWKRVLKWLTPKSYQTLGLESPNSFLKLSPSSSPP